VIALLDRPRHSADNFSNINLHAAPQSGDFTSASFYKLTLILQRARRQMLETAIGNGPGQSSRETMRPAGEHS